MADTYRDEKVILSFTAKRKLDLKDKGSNMIATCLLGPSRTSGVAPDLYTIFLTEKTFFAEYGRKSLHGNKAKKVTKLDIPLEDIVEIGFKQEILYILSDWGKEYFFDLANSKNKELAEEMVDYIKRKNKKK